MSSSEGAPTWGNHAEYYEKAWDDVYGTAEEEIGAVGEVCEIKNSFARVNSHGHVEQWLDSKPYGQDQDTARRNRKLRDIYAVVCGHYPCPGRTWEMRSIWIHNPTLKSALCEVLADHPDRSWCGETLEFSKPFVPLIHRWENLCKVAVDNKGTETQKIMNLFVEMLKHELRDTLQSVKLVKQTGSATFSDLQFVYQPGQLFLRTSPVAAGISHKYDGSGRLTVHQVKSNGIEYGGVVNEWFVGYYRGRRRLSDLNVRPFSTCSKKIGKAIKGGLIQRGRKWEQLVQGQFMRVHIGNAPMCQPEETSGAWPSHHGLFNGWEESDVQAKAYIRGPHLPTQVPEGRVIVDEAGYYKLQGLDDPIDRSILQKISDAKSIKKNSSESAVYKDYEDLDHDSEGDENPLFLSDWQCLLAVSTLKCFSLEKKVWCNVEVNDLINIEWNTQAFDNLVLDAGEKRLLLGFVGATKSGDLRDFDDFIHGKGKGLILLLCGPPGTGKTLTAESVSENLKRPLYRIDASDLGKDTTVLENRLRVALERCARWDAILLLDEADVFLEARSSNNLLQNEMTSIFLRLLEYYKGVMILTTNRFPAIDPAFESRIDITLVFKDLHPDSRAKIWHNFLVREESDLANDSEAIAKLAKARLNGRQIKSAVKTARILAVSEKVPLALDHLETVVTMRKKALRLLGHEVVQVLDDSDSDSNLGF
ncbi:related to TOB3 (member of AAA-ATPase family) [Fusarium torulosum]|uniref:Related to TOB3 (Member of AAA-ATPase family) n=1 Tax=Fusarium torulosum TaxID=33205 RepID=A0AAE8MHE8_9HYPO|nr:related to TOB3 (member of AAA-ATPase family) [Fusarium torulosum]